jgi:hypothetical protein
MSEVPGNPETTAADLAMRLEQAREHMQIAAASRALVDEQVGMIVDAWAGGFGAETVERDGRQYWEFGRASGEVWPKKATLRRFLGDLSLTDVLRAVDIAAARFEGRPSGNATRYFYGICYRALRSGSPIGVARNHALYSLDSPEVMNLETSAFEQGHAAGRAQEHDRLREFLLHHLDNGYSTVGEAALALWPDEE